MTDTRSRPPLEEDLDILEATVEAITAATLGPLGAEEPEPGRQRTRSQSAPAVVARHLTNLGFDQVRVALGLGSIEPDPRDRRFADEWFETSPVYRRLAQSHVATERAIADLVADLDLNDKARLRAELLTTIATSSLAPTNHLLGNPAALKEAWRTKGKSLVDGFRNAVDDLVNNGGMPAMVDREPFTPGETIAATPGSVVYRHPLFELLRYTPTTETVHERPVFIVPPQINKYYVLDLAPGRSLAEHLVSQGQQVFMVSWRNPTAEHAAWDLDTYVDALLTGTDVVRDLTGADDLNLLGVCAGGITASALAGYLAAIGDDRLNTLTLLVTILDWAVPSTMGSLLSPELAKLRQAQATFDGVLSGEELGRTFAWLRPDDLVWNYWANNYLQGKKPPAFDVLAWNVDSTNLPAGLYKDFLDVAVDNQMTEANELVVLDTPIDLSKVEIENFIVGAVTDHITPWKACYQSVDLFGGPSTFVLSSQGHIQALVNPSGNPKGSFQVNPEADATPGVDADTWLAGANTRAGSWWDRWTDWLTVRAGDEVPAPTELGSDDYPVLEAAPGRYVLD